MNCRLRAYWNGRQTVTIDIGASCDYGDPNSSESRHRTHIPCIADVTNEGLRNGRSQL